MKHCLPVLTLCYLLSGAVSTVHSDTGQGRDDTASGSRAVAADSLDSEYEKLLKIIEKERSPVQSSDSTLDIVERPGVGPKESDVVLVEFSDYQCAFCRRHQMGTAQQIYEKLVSTSQLRYVFLDFFVGTRHPLAAKAAIAARCAEAQGKYWEMRSTMYEKQKALDEAFLSSHARTAGLDEKTFNECLKSGQFDAAVHQDQVVGKSLRVKGTPTFFIGINNGEEIKLIRKIQGAQPYEVFEREILFAAKIAKHELKENQAGYTDYHLVQTD